MDILIYVFINAVLIAVAVLAAKFWGLLGALGAVLGGVFSYYTLTSSVLTLQTVYDQTAQVFVYNNVDMGFFGYVPLVLVGLNVVVALKKE